MFISFSTLFTFSAAKFYFMGCGESLFYQKRNTLEEHGWPSKTYLGEFENVFI